MNKFIVGGTLVTYFGFKKVSLIIGCVIIGYSIIYFFLGGVIYKR